MLVSPSANLAFAHFPKTAGTSLSSLLRQALPDARWIDPDEPHVAVREGFRRLRWQSSPFLPLMRLSRGLRGRLVKPCDVALADPRALRVIGVVREPFEMAVSLFEYWHRKLPESQRDHTPLMNAAYRGDYIGFLRILSDDASRFPTYQQFFDLGGPLWPRTFLVDFAHLHDGLAQAFASIGVQVDLAQLGRRNAGQRPDDGMRRREDEAGELADAVRRRYEWRVPVRLLGQPGQARREAGHAA